MRQIETLVFDYGGVIVNIDDASVVKAMESLGVTAFKRLIHVRKIKRLMHQYINGLVAEAETLHSEHNSLLPSFFLQYKSIICSTTCCSSSILFISCLLRR
jgi:hypothetical protein